MKQIITYLLLFFSLLLCQGVLLSQEKKDHNREKAMQENLFNSIQKGVHFDVSGETYAFLPELRAIQQNTLTTSSGKKEILEQKGQFLIYNAEEEAKKISVSSSQQEKLYPIVLNTRTNQLGVLLGNLIVRGKSSDVIKAIPSEYQLDVARIFPRLKLGVFTLQTGQDLLEKFTALRNDPRVETVEIEILENVRVPL